MSKVRHTLEQIFNAEGYLNSDNLDFITIESEEGNIDFTKILSDFNGKFVKIKIVESKEIDLPTIE